MSAIVPPPTDSNSKEDRFKQYLLDRTKDGEMYFKSKFTVDDVSLSPKEIDTLMVKLRNSATDLPIEKWLYTNAATWCIETT